MDDLKTPRRQTSLAAQLVEILRAHIADGGWPVGSRIPSEHELTEQFDVGRSTLREALRALVHLGLLEARAGDGTYVRSASELSAVLERRAAAARREEVLELRAILEEHASAVAAVNRSDADLTTMRELLAEMADAYPARNTARVAEIDRRFHRAVVAASGNTLLAEVYDYLGNALTATVGELVWDEDIARGHTRLHDELLAAIAAADQTAAAHVAAKIIHLTRDHDSQPEDTTP